MYKQVIVMRKFPSLRKGKYIAQGCHASVGALKYAHDKDIEQWIAGGSTNNRQ